MRIRLFSVIALLFLMGNVLAGDGLREVYVLQVIGSGEERFFKPHQKLYQLAKKGITSQDKVFVLAAGDSVMRSKFFGEDGAVYASPENLNLVISQISKKADDDDLLLVFASGHGVGYNGDPDDPYYGFSWVPITTVSDFGRGKTRLEGVFDQWGPRVYGNKPKCLPLDSLGVYTKYNTQKKAFKSYGIKFVADVDSLSVGGKVVSDHSNWVKVVKYYLTTDSNGDGWIEGAEVNQGVISGDVALVSSEVMAIDSCYNPTGHPVISRLTDPGKKNYFFIDRSAGFPQIAVALNTAQENPDSMSIHGYVDGRGYCQLDLNTDGDFNDLVYLNERYEVGNNRHVPDYELADMLCIFPGKIAGYFGQCYAGGMHDVGVRSRFFTYSPTDEFNSSYGEYYEWGWVDVLKAFVIPDANLELSLADIHNGAQEYLLREFAYSEGFLREAHRRVAMYSYNEDSGYEYKQGTIPSVSKSHKLVVANHNKQPIILSAVDPINAVNYGCALEQNYPNPFNLETQINFSVSRHLFVRISVYNLLGQEISVLINSNFAPGQHSVCWNGCNKMGERVASGVYFYQMCAGNFFASKRMVLVKPLL